MPKGALTTRPFDKRWTATYRKASFIRFPSHLEHVECTTQVWHSYIAIHQICASHSLPPGFHSPSGRIDLISALLAEGYSRSRLLGMTRRLIGRHPYLLRPREVLEAFFSPCATTWPARALDYFDCRGTGVGLFGARLFWEFVCGRCFHAMFFTPCFCLHLGSPIFLAQDGLFRGMFPCFFRRLLSVLRAPLSSVLVPLVQGSSLSLSNDCVGVFLTVYARFDVSSDTTNRYHLL